MQMTPDLLELKIQQSIPDAKIQIETDGTHYFVKVISHEFTGKSRIARQQMIYQTVQTELQNGSLHALSLQTHTPEEWENQSKQSHSSF